MDYSLLFVVAYNPKYIQLHPDEFEIEEKKKNYKLKKPEVNPDSDIIAGTRAKKILKKQTDEFVQKMTGMGKKDYKDYQ